MGLLKKEDSWDKFVNPIKVGIDNSLQHAHNTTAQEKAKAQGSDVEDEQEKEQKAGVKSVGSINK